VALSAVSSAAAAGRPAFETTLQESLGLDLVPTDAEVDVVVIDAVPPPSPN
jgi:uncharacterized protein (TIGR03435 family)